MTPGTFAAWRFIGTAPSLVSEVDRLVSLHPRMGFDADGPSTRASALGGGEWLHLPSPYASRLFDFDFE
jgi:hypothetical protein